MGGGVGTVFVWVFLSVLVSLLNFVVAVVVVDIAARDIAVASMLAMVPKLLLCRLSAVVTSLVYRHCSLFFVVCCSLFGVCCLLFLL